MRHMGTESGTEIGVIFVGEVGFIDVPRLLRGRGGAKARTVVKADIRHYVVPTAGMFGECGEEIAVVQVLPKEHGCLTSPTLYGDVQQLHEHARPVKARYAVSKGHNQSENMHRHLYITDVTKQRERDR